MKTLPILLGEHPWIVNISFGPMTIHYREILLYMHACMYARVLACERTVHNIRVHECVVSILSIIYVSVSVCLDS